MTVRSVGRRGSPGPEGLIEVPVAPVAQRYLVTLRHVETWVRSRQTGVFSLKNKKN